MKTTNKTPFIVKTHNVDGTTRRAFRSLAGAVKRFEKMYGHPIDQALDGRDLAGATSIEAVNDFGTVVLLTKPAGADLARAEEPASASTTQAEAKAAEAKAARAAARAADRAAKAERDAAARAAKAEQRKASKEAKKRAAAEESARIQAALAAYQCPHCGAESSSQTAAGAEGTNLGDHFLFCHECCTTYHNKSGAAKKFSKAGNAAGVSLSWNDPEVAAARVTRHSVLANGQEYRSVHEAFTALRLPTEKHIAFRKALKAAGALTFKTPDGKKSVDFQLIERS